MYARTVLQAYCSTCRSLGGIYGLFTSGCKMLDVQIDRLYRGKVYYNGYPILICQDRGSQYGLQFPSGHASRATGYMRSRRPITVNYLSTLAITLNPTQCLPTSSSFAPLSSSFATSTATVSRVASALLRDRNGRSVLGANQNSIVRENAKPSTGKHTSMSHF